VKESNMRSTAWAYEFNCEMSMEQMLEVWNQNGPWKWTTHESYWYGEYLISRPENGVRVRIHHPFQFPFRIGESKAVFAANNLDYPRNYYCALLEVDAEAPAERKSVDQRLHTLLHQVHSRNVREVEHYD